MKVIINKFEYVIKTVPTDCKALIMNEVKHIGICDHLKGEILIDNSLSPVRFKSTLIHELTHAYISCHAFNVYTNTLEPTINEESMCEFISLYAESILDIATKYIIKEKNNV